MHTQLLCLLFAALLFSCGMAPEEGDDRSPFSEGGDPNSGNQGEIPGGGGGNGGGGGGGDETETGFKGAILSISALGVVEGWAVNQDDLTQSVFVFFFVDGDIKTGKEVGSTMAELTGFDGNFSGDHRFSFTIPEAYRNGTSRRITAYMEVLAGEQEITTGPKVYTAFVASAASKTYYANNLLGQFQSNCSSCHQAEDINFDNHFSLLLDPPPSAGGTATNNRLYQKASGNLMHGGGNRCNGGQPCTNIQAWWNAQFN